MRPRILMVDDEQNALAAYRRNLYGEFSIEAATGTVAGLHMLRKKGPFEVVVSDLRMPGIDGTRFLARVREIAPRTTRIMLTGYADAAAAIQAVNQGHVFRILTKPCPPETLRKALRDGVRQSRLVTGERELLEKTLAGCVKLLTDMLRLTAPAAFGRLSRIHKLVRLLLPRYGKERRSRRRNRSCLHPTRRSGRS